MVKESFGTDGRENPVELLTLSNGNGTKVKISTLGATVVSFLFLDKTQTLRDVVLGYDSAEDYLKNNGLYFGASVGRCANRISNAKVTIDGVEYALEANSGSNNLHSGSNGISYKIWEVEHIDEEANCLTLKIVSADLEQGFPGNMTIRAVFTLTEEDALHIEYQAVSDKTTIANFTNHSYFNLAGHDSGNIGGQKLKLYAKAFTPLAPKDSIPTGEIASVKGTPMDFTEPKTIGQEIGADFEQLKLGGGYDHNWVLDDVDGQLQLVAKVTAPGTGRVMKVYTTLPGLQFYAGNFLGDQDGKLGTKYHNRYGLALETQYFPDGIHKENFPDVMFGPDRQYVSSTVYQFCYE